MENMDKKKAFVFDTNFIVQNRELDIVVKNLSSEYTVYVPQVAIDERIAQQCRELKKEYETVQQFEKKCRNYAQVTFTKEYPVAEQALTEWIKASYAKLFGSNIIPVSKDGKTFGLVIDRANRKIAPFSSDDNASDKGFKDCLLWLSLLSFFKNQGEDEIVFVTDDNAFKKDNAQYLINEFNEATGKTIEIKPNSFYKDLTLPQSEKKDKSHLEPIPNLDVLRNQINETIQALCEVRSENSFGDECFELTFKTAEPFDDSIVSIFDRLKSCINSHVFDLSIRATEVFAANSGVVDADSEIPIICLEKALSIYEEIKKSYPDYLEQFYSTAAKILNRNLFPAEDLYATLPDDFPF